MADDRSCLGRRRVLRFIRCSEYEPERRGQSAKLRIFNECRIDDAHASNRRSRNRDNTIVMTKRQRAAEALGNA
jgi:hypothetical protein